METRKKILCFGKRKYPPKIPYISGNGSPEKISYISGSNFPCSKNKKNRLLKSFFYFGKWNFLAQNLKILKSLKKLKKPMLL